MPIIEIKGYIVSCDTRDCTKRSKMDPDSPISYYFHSVLEARQQVPKFNWIVRPGPRFYCPQHDGL